MLLAFVGGVILGMVMAYRRNSGLDHVLSIFASLFYSVPSYLFGIMVIVFFGIRLGWLPIADMRGTLTSGQSVEFSLAFSRTRSSTPRCRF